MTIATAQKPRVVTRRIGGLAALHRSHVQMVVWSRQLTPLISSELLDLAASGLKPVDFVTLTIDPTDRVQQQLAKVKIRSEFLINDIALLVVALGELSKARRIRVCLSAVQDDDPVELMSKRSDLQLFCIYSDQGPRPLTKRSTAKKRSRLAARVVAFRPSASSANEISAITDGLCLRLVTVPEK
jgi:hypothetical protein